MRTISKIIYLVVYGVVVFWFGYAFSRQALRYPDPFKTSDRHIAAQREALDRVPTFKQLQVMVGAEPDGIIGPNTIARWDKKICDQCAIEAMERMAKE